mgnify:CR=1 FL=1
MTAELDKLAVLRLILEEAFGDGALSAKEQQMIMSVTRLLQIEPAAHQKIFIETESRYKQGEIKKEGELSPETLYRRVVQLARQDGAITTEENLLLDQLCDFLELTPEERATAEAP